MTEGRDREKTRESGKIPHQRLGPNLLPEVKLDVALKHFVALVGGPHEGNRPPLECGVQVEVVAEFGGRERIHGPAQRPAREQVDPCRLQLARTRAEQCELELSLLDESVHFVQQIGQALDLVDHDPACGW